MKERFSLLQLFSIVDGRSILLNLEDECKILSFITNHNVNKDNITLVKEHIKNVIPGWYRGLSLKFLEFGIKPNTPLDECLEVLKKVNKIVFIPQFNNKQRENLLEYLDGEDDMIITAGGAIHNE